MKKPNILSRIGTYGANRIQPSGVREGSRKVLSSGGAAAMRSLRPTAADPAELMAGLNGRYSDGGRARFRSMMSELNIEAQDLPALEASHSRNFTIMLGASTVFMLGAVLMILFGDGAIGFLAAVILLIFALGSTVNAIRSDYSGWQIREQAFGGFREYLRSRFFAASA